MPMDRELNEAEDRILELEMQLGMSRACTAELRAELEQMKSVIPCTFLDCMSARAVRAAGEEYQRGVAEGLERAVKLAEGWEGGLAEEIRLEWKTKRGNDATPPA